MSEDKTENQPMSEGRSVLLTEGSFVADEVVEDTKEAIEETLSEKLEKLSTHEEGNDEPSYVSPVPDPYARAIRYMEKHNVMQIFQKLTAEIIYHRPDDPLNHMLEELQKMKKDRESNSPPASPE